MLKTLTLFSTIAMFSVGLCHAHTVGALELAGGVLHGSDLKAQCDGSNCLLSTTAVVSMYGPGNLQR